LQKLPPPPRISELRKTTPVVKTLFEGTELWRLYRRGGDHPSKWNEFRAFGPLSFRFDHQTTPKREQPRAILYAATWGPICVAEVFQDTRTIDRFDRDPWLVSFRLQDDIELLDLTGLWPVRAKATMAIGSSGARSRTRHWSRNIYAAYPGIVGLWYASSMYGNQPMVALYERARRALPRVPSSHASLAAPALFTALQNTANELGYGLV